MSKKNLTSSSGQRSASAMARDSRGRWVRRPAATAGSPEFTFDETALAELQPTASPNQPLSLDECDRSAPEVAALREGAEAFTRAAREPALPPAAAQEPPGLVRAALWALAATLALAGILAVTLRFGSLGAGPFARSITGGGAASASEHSRSGGREPAAAAAGPSDVPRLVIPPIPRLRTPPRLPAVPADTPHTKPGSHPPSREDADAPGDPAAVEDDEETQFALAEEYLQVEDTLRAEQIYRRVLDHGTQRGRAALALGDILTGRGEYERARALYLESRSLYSDSNPSRPSP